VIAQDGFVQLAGDVTRQAEEGKRGRVRRDEVQNAPVRSFGLIVASTVHDQLRLCQNLEDSLTRACDAMYLGSDLLLPTRPATPVRFAPE
jgi:hypothetical protein